MDGLINHRTGASHPKILEGPVRMWGCKPLYQDTVFQPLTWPICGSSREQLTKVTARMPIFKSTAVLNRPLWHSRVVSIQEQLLSRNVERFRGGLVFKAYRLLHHSTLGSREKERVSRFVPAHKADARLVPFQHLDHRLPELFVCRVEDSHLCPAPPLSYN